MSATRPASTSSSVAPASSLPTLSPAAPSIHRERVCSLLNWLARKQRLGHAATQAPDLSLWSTALDLRYHDHTLRFCVESVLGLLVLIAVPVLAVDAIFLIPLAPHAASFWDNSLYHFFVWPLLTFTAQLFTAVWFYFVCSLESLSAEGVKTRIAIAIVTATLLGYCFNMFWVSLQDTVTGML